MAHYHDDFMTPCAICGSMTDVPTIRTYGECDSCRRKRMQDMFGDPDDDEQDQLTLEGMEHDREEYERNRQ